MENDEKSYYAKMLGLALDIGISIISYGGSISRAETAVNKICMAHGVKKCDVVIMNNAITCDITIPDNRHVIQMQKSYSISNNLKKLESVILLSYRITDKKLTVEEGEKQLNEIKNSVGHPSWVGILGGGFAVGACAALNGGNLLDDAIATVVGFLLVYLTNLMSNFAFNGYAKSFVLSLIGGLASILPCYLLTLLNIEVHVSVVMIGTLMIIIPGLNICNAVRDLFAGDTFSGSSQLINGIIGTIMVAIGYAAAMTILEPILIIISPTPISGVAYYVYTMIAVIVVSVGFSLFFTIRYIRLPFTVMNVIISYTVLMLLNYFVKDSFIATTVATAAAAIIAEILARIYKRSTTVFFIPALLPLIPGGQLYNCMYHLVRFDGANAWAFGFEAMMLFIAIGVGLSAVTIFFQTVYPVKNKIHISLRYKKTNWWEPKKKQR